MPDKDAKDKDVADKAALEKATGIAKQLKEKPSDQDLWNKLAKESSDDPGSKDSGG
ncbi:MAG: peptidylprolyl isomerase PrsA, partial [Chloroflexi bacterium]